MLEATVNRAAGLSFPIVVVGNHLLGPNGIDSNDPDGLTTVGDRMRQKRLAQAAFLANYVQSRQTTTPGEHIVVAGDFNASEFNDGYADVMNVIAGTPPPDNETVVPGDGVVDLVNPDLVNLVNTPPAAERYSEVDRRQRGQPRSRARQRGLVADTTARRIEHPRINADYPETERNNNATALRVSDRDPVVAYFAPLAFTTADLSVTKDDTPDPVTAGQNLTYTITVDQQRAGRRRLGVAVRHACRRTRPSSRSRRPPAGRARRRRWARAAPSRARSASLGRRHLPSSRWWSRSPRRLRTGRC